MMATAGASLLPSKEKANFLRLAALVIDGGTLALKTQFDLVFPPPTLGQDLQDQANFRIILNLKNRKIIKQAQYDLLIPPPHKVADSSDFDVTLLSCLIQNLLPFGQQHSPVWTQPGPPAANDFSLAAEVKRLRYLRNYGYHFLCKLCTVVKHYFKTKFEVQRHLQDQHSGIGHQCTGCGYLFNRRNLKHKCQEEHPDFVFVNRQSGAQGAEARETLMNFIKKEQDTHWVYVRSEDEPESPIPTGLRSVVVKPNDPVVHPRPRKEKKGKAVPSPVILDNYEDDIHLEEPPRKVQRMSTQSLLEDLECSPCTSEDTGITCNLKEKSEAEQKRNGNSERNKENMHEKESEKGKSMKKTKETEVKAQVLREMHSNKLKDNEKAKDSNKQKDNEKKKDRVENLKERKVGSDKKKDGDKEKNSENVQIEKGSDKMKDGGKGKETEKGKSSEKGNKTIKGKEHVHEKATDKQRKTEKEKGSDKKKDGESEKGPEKGKSEKGKETLKEKGSENEKTTDKERDTEKGKEKMDKGNKVEKKDTTKETVKLNEVNKEDKTEIEGKKSKNSDVGLIMVENETLKERNNENVNGKKIDDGEKEITVQSSDCDVEMIGIENETVNEEDNENVDENIRKETEIKTKRVISIQEYTRRDKIIQADKCEMTNIHEPLLIEDIMVKMSETYPIPSCVTPIRDLTPEPQSPPPPSPTTDDEETWRAVASICVEDGETELTCENYRNETVTEAGMVRDCENTYIQDIVSCEIIDEVANEIIRSDVEDELARKEEKKQRRAEKRKRRAEKEAQKDAEEERTDIELKRKIKKREEMLAYLKVSQESRVLLNIGGTRFETSESTLKQDPDSFFSLLFRDDTPNRDNYFIDRDPAHFRLILNYLRCGCSLPSEAILPRELKYLLEIKSECEFYNLQGLKEIVESRLRRFSEPGFST